jgi:CHAT domain-containing protein/tetratricopeptide (TPR) repeat protein
MLRLPDSLARSSGGPRLRILPHLALALIAGATAVFYPQAAATQQEGARTGESARESIKKLEESIERFRQAGDSKAEADALVNLAAAYERLNDFRSALGSYLQALPLYRAGNNRPREAFVLNRLGSTHGRLSEYQKAIDFYNQALPLLRAEKDRGGEAAALNGMGSAYRSLSDFQQALDAFNQSLPLYRAIGDRRGEASALNRIAAVHFARGESLKAVDLNDQALAIYRAEGDRAGQASIIQQLGQSYYHLGEYQKAIDLYGEALEIQRASGNHRGEGSALGLFGQVYSFLGENQRALEYMNQALSIFRAFGDRELESVALNNSAHVYLLMGEHQKAIEIFNQALEMSRLSGNRSSEGFNLHGLGIVYAGLGDHRKALDFHRQAVNILRAVGNGRGQAATLSHMGNSHLALGEHQQALDSLNEALSVYRRLSVPRGQAQSLYTMARTYQARGARGDLLEARSSVEAAIKIAETFRHDVTSQQLRTSYFASVRDYYELNIDLLMQLDKERRADGLAALAFEASERARARSLLDLLSETRTDIREGVDAALLARELSLRQSISARAERQTQLQSGRGTPEQIATAAREIAAAIAEHQDVQAKIRAGSPRYAALAQPEPLTIKQIREQVLDSETLLLEYALGEKRSYLWAITQTAITGYELPGRAEIESAARKFYDLVKENAKGEELEQSAARLSEMLLAPAAGQLGKLRLAVVADGALQYLPFAALPRPEATAAESRSIARAPLIVAHEIVMLPSASTLAVLRRETKGRALAPRLVAVLADPVFDGEDVRVRRASADGGGSERQMSAIAKDSALVRSVEETGLAGGRWPLPRLLGTRREARNILALAPREKSREAIDFEASRETARSADLGQYQIVHFATHALINNRHPELSGLVFSLYDKQARPQDGFLRLNDIYNLRLPAELVVLSACQTGLGKEVRGEGFVGLTQGFMYAGARRLMASLWQVDDAATSELMGRFYRRMLTGKRLSPAAALREAQIEMWKQRSWRSPYFWAGFVVQGEWK